MRSIVTGAAQMGAIQKAESRTEVVARMLRLLEEAAAAGCDLVVYPELCLTTFFPRWYTESRDEILAWFEREMPGPETAPLFRTRPRARDCAVTGICRTYPEGRRFNTQIVTDRAGRIVGKYRKIHLPGHADFDPARSFQHLEKYYFEPGDLGFPVFRNLDAWMGMLICNDRRWPEAYRELGLQGAELILRATTLHHAIRRTPAKPELRQFHSDLSVQAGAYQNSAGSCRLPNAALRTATT
ncbi:MAG: N-carbamoyl-D-amino-acid hydrolase [Rhodobacter sp.]|nr:N-carbamoyl-D-amino-acid hydrolase [Rhodobacter sp.]